MSETSTAPPPGDMTEPSTGTGTPAAPRVPRWRSILRNALLLVMLVFAVGAIARNWAKLGSALSDLSPWTVAASFVPAILAILAGLMVWRAVLADLGAPMSVPAAARVFFLSQLGKYLPGAIWSIASQMELTRELNVPRRTSLAGGVLAIAVSTTVGLQVAAVTLVLGAPDIARRFWWALVAIPALLAMLHPAVLGRLMNIALKVLRRPPLPRPPTLRGLLTAAGWQLVGWAMLGLHAWLLIVSVGGTPGRSIPVAIGGYALGYSLGLLALLPSGLGVRDTALIVTFSTVIPAPAAVVVALVSRIVLAVVDIGMAAIQHIPAVRRRAQADHPR